MSRIWDFFENLNDLVYVADPTSYELVYLNRALLQALHLPSHAAIAGKKCYEVLQGNNGPCLFCNNASLREGHFTEWRYYNPLLHKNFLIRNTLVNEDSKLWRLEMAMNLDALQTQGHDVVTQKKLALQVNEAIRLALEAPSPDAGIDIVLEYLGKALHARRAYLFEKDQEGRDSNTHEWTSLGVCSEKDNLQNLPPEICEPWYRTFNKHEYVLIRDIEDIRTTDPCIYNILLPQKIRSLVVVPLYSKGKTIGFYGLDDPPIDLLEEARNTLQLMGYFLATSIRRKTLLRQLWQLSHHDQLTGLQNRHAMLRRLETLHAAEGVGIAYGDVSGLKALNDTQGHKAGDALLTRAAHCLKEAFATEALYRIGGDEFLILCSDMTETDFEARLADLRRSLTEHAVDMALGHTWSKCAKDGLEPLVRLAEERSYRDKELYYRHPARERRLR